MSLNSKTTLKIIDALCEGPIEGLVEHRKSVFLNETLITGKQLNEQTVKYMTKLGTGSQGPFNEGSSFKDRQTTIIQIGREVGSNYSERLDATGTKRKGEPDYGEGQVTQTLNNQEIDFVELVFTIPKLYCVAAEGLARGQLFFAQIKIELSIAGKDGVWNQVHIEVENQNKRNIIKGICTSPYQFKTQTIDVKQFGKGPYKIRVRKVKFTEPEDAFEISFNDFEDISKKTPIANKRADKLVWSSIVTGKYFGTAYPHTALVSLSLDSEEYSTLPARAYDIKGLKVQIPSNATVEKDGRLSFDSRVPFDGTLREDSVWTTCPVCCFFDLLTNKRYGAGDFIDADSVNWVDLIELAKYSNELVSNADGSVEARFALNTQIGSQAEAFSVLQDMASVFRGMLFWKSDNVQVAADHGELNNGDVPVVHIFNNSNVINGSFAYSGSSLKTRSTRVRIRYNDPDNFYKPNFVCIEDRALIAKYGVLEKSIVAFGCTSKYQAQRMGQWVLMSEKLHDETVTFSVGLEGLNVLPGQVFGVTDEMRTAGRYGGRLKRVNNSEKPPNVRLDQNAVIPSGVGKITIVQKDGTLETKDIVSVDGKKVEFETPLAQVPEDDALYAIFSASTPLIKYRCLAVTEGEDGSYNVIGVKHRDGIYEVVENQSSDLALAPTSIYGPAPDAPTTINIDFQSVDDGRNTINRATISWTRGLTGAVVVFKVRYKIGDGGNWIDTLTNNNFITVTTGLIPHQQLIVQVKSIGPRPDSKESGYTSFQRVIPVPGTSDPSGGKIFDDDTKRSPDGIFRPPLVQLPPDPEEVEVELFGLDQVILSWSPIADGQNLEAFVAVIRHAYETNGEGKWENSALLRKIEARTSSTVLPLLNGEYLVKFENAQKLRSKNAASALINVPDAIPRLNYLKINETPSYGKFNGEGIDVYYNDNYDGLILSGPGDFDGITKNINEWVYFVDGKQITVDEIIDFEPVTKGTYFFQYTVDLGGVFSVRIKRDLTAEGLYYSKLIDDITARIDSPEWGDFDGATPEDNTVKTYFQKSNEAETPGAVVLLENDDTLQYENNELVLQESDLIYEDWIPLENNAYVGRSFQFKAELSTDRPDQTPIIKRLGVTLQLERRVENSVVMESGLNGRHLEFDHPFFVGYNAEVAVGINALDMGPGDYYVVSNVTAEGFDIQFFGTANNGVPINRRFSYTAVGYGKRESI